MQLALFYARNGTALGSWDVTGLSLTIFQTLQVVEIVHCIVGLVVTDPVVTFVQVYSRVMMLWMVLIPFTETRGSLGFAIALTAWSVAEITRYAFYALKAVDRVPFILTWARYTFFILLYPTGVAGELLILYVAQPFMKTHPLITRFDVYLMYLHLIPYVVLFPNLYGHLLKQRKKALGGNISTKQK